MIDLHSDCDKVVITKAIHLENMQSVWKYSVKWYQDNRERYHQTIVGNILFIPFMEFVKSWNKIDGYPPETRYMGMIGWRLNE